MAFHHVVLLRWNSDASAADIARVKPALDALATTLGGVQTYRCGESLGLTETSSDFGIVGIFEDRDAWDAYMADAEHDRIRRDLIGPIVRERAGIQFET